MSEENNDHIPNKNPKPDPPMDEKRVVPPDMDDKGTPLRPKPPEKEEDGDAEAPIPHDSGWLPKIDPEEDEMIKFLMMMGLL
ncbi:MAG: hypothetical protein NTZ78_11325 [Candidatus Aureabacteria bacterium]|nr:hypothetical protein [Candidatus Auribacterota bacterium]